jgi:glucokinase
MAMNAKQFVLAGDIGGTKTNLAIFSVHDQRLRVEKFATFPSKRYSGLVPVVREFMAGDSHVADAASFGIAGAVVDNTVKTPNLAWMVDGHELARALGPAPVHLLNDLEAAAYGIFTLEPDELLTLNEGVIHYSGNKALIAAGTGLGQSILYDDGRHFCPLASEAGHADFAPRNELEIELLRYLLARYPHVSYERVLSGPGLLNIYAFLREARGIPEPPWLAERLAGADDMSAEISRTALAGEADICVQALDLFVSIYGAEAGNLALRAKSVRGVYVGGGIAPKIIAKLKDGKFMRAFSAKGRYADLLAAVPVQVVLNDRAPLRGAAYYAAFIADQAS